jgi:hypothetical protein
MAKKPKITVKHYLNKNLKPLIKNDTEYYPLYVEVILKSRRSTFKSRLKEFEFLTQNEFQKHSHKLSVETNMIKDIIQLLKPHDRNSFAMKGISESYNLFFIRNEMISYQLVMNRIERSFRESDSMNLFSIIDWPLPAIQKSEDKIQSIVDILTRHLDSKSQLNKKLRSISFNYPSWLYSLSNTIWKYMIQNGEMNIIDGSLQNTTQLKKSLKQEVLSSQDLTDKDLNIISLNFIAAFWRRWP